ncbi:hypothetical protein [Nocardia brasiliensis]|uniref:hypothetical protein n=1 Tax=Nocardia brasiliensis TaxID=37326 RepID=UPI002454136F|nr:hypothetical protein [Nocardia brasiliensis]
MSEPYRLLKRGDPVIWLDAEGNRHVAYVKDWESVNGVCTITTVARREYVDQEWLGSVTVVND